MNIENNQTRFNHEDWLKHLYSFIDTARQFFNELLLGLKSIARKGLLEIWKDIRSAGSRLTPQDFVITGLITLAGMFGGLIFMTGLGLFGYQAFLWLQDGTWTEFPLFMVFDFLFENTHFHQWMVQPESWVGLQKIFSWILESTPISLALMVPGFSIVLFMAGTLAVALLYRFYHLRNKNDR